MAMEFSRFFRICFIVFTSDRLAASRDAVMSKIADSGSCRTQLSAQTVGMLKFAQEMETSCEIPVPHKNV